jgi:hypothetical protein
LNQANATTVLIIVDISFLFSPFTFSRRSTRNLFS